MQMPEQAHQLRRRLADHGRDHEAAAKYPVALPDGEMTADQIGFVSGMWSSSRKRIHRIMAGPSRENTGRHVSCLPGARCRNWSGHDEPEEARPSSSPLMARSAAGASRTMRPGSLRLTWREGEYIPITVLLVEGRF
jgi:hypothetical protein